MPKRCGFETFRREFQKGNKNQPNCAAMQPFPANSDRQGAKHHSKNKKLRTVVCDTAVPLSRAVKRNQHIIELFLGYYPNCIVKNWHLPWSKSHKSAKLIVYLVKLSGKTFHIYGPEFKRWSWDKNSENIMSHNSEFAERAKHSNQKTCSAACPCLKRARRAGKLVCDYQCGKKMCLEHPTHATKDEIYGMHAA